MRHILTALFIILILPGVYSQELKTIADSSKLNSINVFFDCEFCDIDYIKQEISYVNYVRDQNESNIYIIITSQSTGSGGTEYTIMFAGMKYFEFMNDIFIFVTGPDDTENEIRAGMTNKIKLGLMRYIVKTPLSDQISVSYSKPEAISEETVKDKWDNWVFGVNVSGFYSGEESYNYQSGNGSVYANRITEKYKFLLSSSVNYRESNFTIGDEVISSFSNSKRISNTWVKSLGPHWSAGYFTDLYSYSYTNYNLRYTLLPSVEYNLFPYSESTSKQLLFLYGAGFRYAEYVDTTIFNKKEESLFAQSMDISLKIIKNWGSASTSVSAFVYMHDLTKNNLNLYTDLSFRIVKGLSLNLYGGISFIHDQIYLPKTSASSEEILLQQRQLATQYSFYGSAGVSYTFGSVYNNIVNPRFGG